MPPTSLRQITKHSTNLSYLTALNEKKWCLQLYSLWLHVHVLNYEIIEDF